MLSLGGQRSVFPGGDTCSVFRRNRALGPALPHWVVQCITAGVLELSTCITQLLLTCLHWSAQGSDRFPLCQTVLLHVWGDVEEKRNSLPYILHFSPTLCPVLVRGNSNLVYKVIAFCDLLTGSKSNFHLLFARVISNPLNERWGCWIEAYIKGL